MLQKLSIRNYALIDNLEIDLNGGLNIVTGETGAGKSIILGALSLILGQRAESRYFFNQEKKCVIEGLFTLEDENIRFIFEQNDLDFFKETILRREISIDGKSRSFVNDTPVNLNLLKTIGEQLIAIHSQHATQEINNPDFQLAILDALADHQALLDSYKTGFKQLKTDQTTLKTLLAKADEDRKKQDYEQFLYDELASVKLKVHEQEELEMELEKLNHAETIKRSILIASGLLNENDSSVINLLKEASQQLSHVEKYDIEINSLYERLRSNIIEIKDIANELSIIEANTIHDENRLTVVQERLDIIYSLQQKHRVNHISELLAIQQELENNLHQLQHSDEKIEQLKISIENQTSTLTGQANELHKNRLKAIQKVEKEISETLKNMVMPNAKLVVNLDSLNELGKNGLDTVQLLFSANAGHQPAPIAKIASGGELSRLMLAIKALLAKHTALPTLIFDEIDTGISGETALKVGEVIAKLGENMQILAITHLPQIAAKGQSHYFVHKDERHNKTTTGIKKLLHEERIVVIAEMLSGKNPGESALKNAKELLD
jgi:DNA repair protein RecN (Recombination protein N)